MPDLNQNNSVFKQIKLIRKYIKLKICEDNITFRGHKVEREHVYNLIRRVVLNGESHSAMMIGPRGSGKTTLINSVLNQLESEVDLENDAIIVKLNGLVHHDDKIALKAITAQMQLDNAVGDRVFGTFAENLSFLFSCILTGQDRKCKSMIFILDQCDMFCHGGISQTLLYNLFDITHSQQAAMCVVGITNRLDIMDLLEKRVKSRFSHRNIYILPNEDTKQGIEQATINNPHEAFRQLLVLLLSIPLSLGRKETKKRKGRGNKKTDKEQEMEIDMPHDFALSEAVMIRCKVDKNQFAELDQSFIQDWNEHVASLAEDEKVIDSLEKLSYYTVNEQIYRDILFQIVSTLSTSKPFIEEADITAAIDKTVSCDHRVKMLQSLSILEFSLVLALKHGMEIFDGQPMNFEMVLHRYTKFANANSSTQTVPRPVILKAFEHLQDLEIIMPVRPTDSIHNAGGTTASRVQKEYQLYTLAVPLEDLQEAVKGFKALPTEIKHWFDNSIV